MAKTEYEIGDRVFHVEKSGKAWTGWFMDNPAERFNGCQKFELLCSVGYAIPSSGTMFLASDGKLTYGPPQRRSMRDAYEQLMNRVDSGCFPKFKRDRPLSRFVVFARDRCTCFYCGKDYRETKSLHVDHIVAVSRDGSHNAGNVVTACENCNLRKHDSIPDNLSEIQREIARRNEERSICNDHGLEWLEALDRRREDAAATRRRRVR